MVTHNMVQHPSVGRDAGVKGITDFEKPVENWLVEGV